MQRRLLCALGFLALVSAAFPSVEPVTALDKIKFPYSPISYHSLPWLVAYEAKLFEKHELEVDPVFAGASSLIVQSMLAGEADLAEQLVGLKLFDAAAAQKTPPTAYYDNRYVDELERLGFFKRLWQ